MDLRGGRRRRTTPCGRRFRLRNRTGGQARKKRCCSTATRILRGCAVLPVTWRRTGIRADDRDRLKDGQATGAWRGVGRRGVSAAVTFMRLLAFNMQYHSLSALYGATRAGLSLYASGGSTLTTSGVAVPSVLHAGIFAGAWRGDCCARRRRFGGKPLLLRFHANTTPHTTRTYLPLLLPADGLRFLVPVARLCLPVMAPSLRPNAVLRNTYVRDLSASRCGRWGVPFVLMIMLLYCPCNISPVGRAGLFLATIPFCGLGRVSLFSTRTVDG